MSCPSILFFTLPPMDRGKLCLFLTVFLLAITVLAQKPSLEKVTWTCEAGWREKPKSHKCYKVFAFSSAWRTGLNYCSSFGGRLAIIDSLDTQSFLANLLNDFLQQAPPESQRSSVYAWIGLMYIDNKFHWIMDKQTQDNYKTGFYSSSVKPPAIFGPESQGSEVFRWAKGEPNAKECGALYAINNASDLYEELLQLGYHSKVFALPCNNTLPPASSPGGVQPRNRRRAAAVICETQQQQTDGGRKKDQDKIQGDLVSLDPSSDNPLQGNDEALMASVGNQNELPTEWSVATQYWQDGVIPYVFESNFSKFERRQLRERMQFVTRNCKCVKFIPRASEPDYLKFERTLASSCAAKGVGWIGGKQKIVIGPTCFQNIGLITHELLHILGMPHEHQRPDRDRFVIINLDNIAWTARKQFAKFNETLRTWDGFDYDFESIMHYPPDAFSFLPDKLKSIEVNFPLNTSKWQQANAKLQQAQKKLSELDRIKLNRLYCATSGTVVTAAKLDVVPPSPAPMTVPEIPGPSNPFDLNNNNNIAPATDAEIMPALPCGYWVNGDVPYLFDGNFKASEIKRAENIFAQIMAELCGITFRRKQPTDVNYVLFTHSDWENYCYAQAVGKCGGAQRVFFGSNCVMQPHNKGRFLHEVLHVLGLQHEFQRPDRDNYIIVNEDNIPYNDRHSYAKYKTWLPGWLANKPYDFKSVMHYVNDDKIQVRPEWHYASLLGTRLELSEGDKAKLRRLYPTCKPSKPVANKSYTDKQNQRTASTSKTSV